MRQRGYSGGFAAGIIAGSDPVRVDALPDSDGFPNEIIMHRAHRIPYDRMYRNGGGRLMLIGAWERTDPAELEEAITDRTAAIAFNRSQYCGPGALPFEQVVEIAHARNVPVYVDEAWGPHFHFHPALPQSAMDSGVDGAVASTHKVLGAFTQSAVLHIKGPRVNPGRVAATVGMAQTTSPAAFILATIDGCRRQMVLHGRKLLEVAIELADDARYRLQRIPGISVLDADSLGVAAYDLTKLVIDVHGLGLTGFQVENELRYRYRINPESSS